MTRPQWEIPATLSHAATAVSAIGELGPDSPADLAAILAGLHTPTGPSVLGALTDALDQLADAARALDLESGTEAAGWLEDAATRISAVADECLDRARADLEQAGGAR